MRPALVPAGQRRVFLRRGMGDEQERLQHEVGVQSIFFRPRHRSGHGKHAGLRAQQRHCRQRALDRGNQQGQRRSRGCRPRSERDARTHAGQRRRHQADERRCHRGLQSHRKDADLFHPEGPQSARAGASANCHWRPERNHSGGKARRAGLCVSRASQRSFPRRAGHGRGDRRRTANRGTLRQHGRGHRWRHNRYRGHLYEWHCLFTVRARGGQRDGRSRHAIFEAQVQPAGRRTHGGTDQNGNWFRLSAGETAYDGSERPQPHRRRAANGHHR